MRRPIRRGAAPSGLRHHVSLIHARLPSLTLDCCADCTATFAHACKWRVSSKLHWHNCHQLHPATTRPPPNTNTSSSNSEHTFVQAAASPPKAASDLMQYRRAPPSVERGGTSNAAEALPRPLAAHRAARRPVREWRRDTIHWARRARALIMLRRVRAAFAPEAASPDHSTQSPFVAAAACVRACTPRTKAGHEAVLLAAQHVARARVQ